MIDPKLRKFYAALNGKVVEVEPIRFNSDGEVDLRTPDGREFSKRSFQLGLSVPLAWGEAMAVIRALEGYASHLASDTSRDAKSELSQVRWVHERLQGMIDEITSLPNE